MRLLGPDHVVLVSPDPERLLDWYGQVLGAPAERLELWRDGKVPFVSLRISPTFLIDITRGDRTGTNVDHLAIAVDDIDLDQLATTRDDVEMGPADLFGAQGDGRGIYLRDPDGNRLELRTYPRPTSAN
jgi:catechol 2,3-dioxygenase-like lactoylglutathione lyase family enzyme